ncbi:hypothetical protein ACFFWD_00505 [Bradyrhizobium erythrophlei]|uniref:hypothetical protein n=1 Tax=Bradyrhizobium erythrophlei TaxID=1437360 RepID=UPI0035EB6509
MKANSTIDTAKLGILLNELRLLAIKLIWPKFAEQADKEGWPAARFCGYRFIPAGYWTNPLRGRVSALNAAYPP